jgi:hypothetical protein
MLNRRELGKVVGGALLTIPTFIKETFAQALGEKEMSKETLFELEQMIRLDEVVRRKQEIIKEEWGIEVDFIYDDKLHAFNTLHGERVTMDVITSMYVRLAAIEEIEMGLEKYPKEELRKFTQKIFIGSAITIKGIRYQKFGRIAGLAKSLDGVALMAVQNEALVEWEAKRLIDTKGTVFTPHAFDHELGHNICLRISYKDWLVHSYGIAGAPYPEYGNWPRTIRRREDPRVRREGYALEYGYTNYVEDIATCVEILFNPELFTPTVLNDKILMRKLGILMYWYNKKLNLDIDYWLRINPNLAKAVSPIVIPS